MRIVTTEKGKTTTLDKTDLNRIDRLQLTLRVLARECPLIPAYSEAKEALDNVLAMFGEPRKVIESFIVKPEDQTDGSEQPASGTTPEPTTDEAGAADTEPAAATG